MSHNNIIANFPTVGSVKAFFYKYVRISLPINSPGEGKHPCGTPLMKVCTKTQIWKIARCDVTKGTATLPGSAVCSAL